MELSGLNIQQQQMAATQTAVSANETLRPVETATTPVITGENVKIRTVSDFNKLLAELEAKRQDKELESRQSCFSAALAILDGSHATLTEARAEVAAASDALTLASEATAEAQATYDASNGVLSDETAKLNKMVGDADAEVADRVAKGEPEESAKAAVQAEIDAQKQVVADQKEVVARDKQELDQAKAAEAEAENELAAAIADLDALLASEVLVAAAAAARQLAAAVREQPEGEELVAKVDELVEKLDTYVQRADDMKEDELRETVAKIAPDLAFLVTANYKVAPGDLPQYERRV